MNDYATDGSYSFCQLIMSEAHAGQVLSLQTGLS